MFTNFKNRVISVLAPDLPPLPSPDYQRNHGAGSRQIRQMPDKFSYARPPFLQLLTADELHASADHNVRPIIVPRDINLLPWGTGYAECVNSGKSEWNEDQGAFCRQVLSDPEHKYPDMPYTYFGVFDGHAGYGAALAASHQFHHILHEKLVDCIDLLLPREDDQLKLQTQNSLPHPAHFQRKVNKDELIIGALESAFFHMDSLIAQDRDRYRDAGGCTACVALFIDGKMFVANAGDSRAILCQRKVNTEVFDSSTPTTSSNSENSNNTEQQSNTFAVPFSFDHTPETERERLLNVARLKPNLLGRYYIAMEYARRPHNKDLGQRILCRQGTMKGWTYKTLTQEDLLMPVVTGEGKRSRLLGTLGVTRGFGDHDLLAIYSGLQIKPFLTPQPDVNYRDLAKVVCIPDENNTDGDYGVLVMATDGLWDVSENEGVARTVFQTLAKYPTEKRRYTMVAQELVARARGKINDSGHWRLADSKAAATVDDITVIVIPVYQYYKDHLEWTQRSAQLHAERLAKLTQIATEAREQTTLANGLAESSKDNNKFDTYTELDDDNNTDNVLASDDDDEEEIVVELHKDKLQAQVTVEPEIQSEMKIQPAEASEIEKCDNLVADIDAATSDLTINDSENSITAEEKQNEAPQLSPTKSGKNNNNKQHKRNRNTKDKH